MENVVLWNVEHVSFFDFFSYRLRLEVSLSNANCEISHSIFTELLQSNLSTHSEERKVSKISSIKHVVDLPQPCDILNDLSPLV